MLMIRSFILVGLKALWKSIRVDGEFILYNLIFVFLEMWLNKWSQLFIRYENMT